MDSRDRTAEVMEWRARKGSLGCDLFGMADQLDGQHHISLFGDCDQQGVQLQILRNLELWVVHKRCVLQPQMAEACKERQSAFESLPLIAQCAKHAGETLYGSQERV